MQESNVKRFWYMDWFGHFLNYDSENARIFRVPANFRAFPDFFAIVPQPSILPSRAIFRQHASMINGLPHIEMVDAGNGRVAFKDISTQGYLTINPRSDVVAFAGGAILDWEKFLPLSENDMKALALLSSPAAVEIKNQAGELLPAMGLGSVVENKGDMGFIGSFEFPIGRNLKALSALHTSLEGSAVKLELVGYEGRKEVFTIFKKEVKKAEEA